MSTPPTAIDLANALARAIRAVGAEYAQLRATILKHPAALGFLRERVGRGGSWRERLTAAMLLGWLEHKAERDHAFALLKDPASRRTKTVIGVAKPNEVAEEIATFGAAITPWVIEAWLKTQEHVDGWEEAVLALALAELRDPRSLEPMSELFEDRAAAEAKRISAALVLEKLADRRAWPVAERVLRDTTEPDAVRLSAASILIGVEPSTAHTPIEEVLNDPSSSIELQKGLAYSLADLSDPASKPALERALASARDPDIVPALAFALGRVGDAASIELLRATAARMADSATKDACDDGVREIELRQTLAQQRD